MSKPHQALGDRLRRLIDDSGISQRELARKLKVGPNQVSRWVVGAVAPTYTVLNDILKLCRKQHEAGWLLTGKSPKIGTEKDLQSYHHEDIISTSDNIRGEEEDSLRELIETLKAFNQHLQDENAQLKQQLDSYRLGESEASEG